MEILFAVSAYDTVNKTFITCTDLRRCYNKNYCFGVALDSFDFSPDEEIPTDYKPSYYSAKELNLITLREEISVNTQTGKTENKITSLTMNIPGDCRNNVIQKDIPIATFKFEDLIKLFSNNKAAMYNEKLNYAEALMLGLYNYTTIRITALPEDQLFIFDEKINNYVVKKGLEKNILYQIKYHPSYKP